MDLNYMARDFDCDAAFLRQQQVTDTHVRFAHAMRRVHDTPISIIVPRGNLNQCATWDARMIAEHDRLNTQLVNGHDPSTAGWKVGDPDDDWYDDEESDPSIQTDAPDASPTMGYEESAAFPSKVTTPITKKAQTTSTKKKTDDPDYF